MNKLVSRISSYNLFNYLLPGVIFSFLLDNYTGYSMIQENIVIGLFLYYFVGLVISRIGSLAVAPFLKWIKFVEFANYLDFVKASKDDEDLIVFSEQNNMYRTFVTVFAMLFFLKAYELLSSIYPSLKLVGVVIFPCLVFFLFLASYKKATNDIKNRISINSEK